MRASPVAALVACALAALTPARSQAPQGSTYRVRVTVSASNDKTTEDLVTSYVSRELRSLNDVVISDGEHLDYTLGILAMKVHQKDAVIGYAVSAVVMEPVPTGYLESAAKNSLSKGVLDDLMRHFQDVYRYHGNSLYTGPPASLQDMCKELVAQFDAEHLEPQRKIWRLLMEHEAKTR